MMISSCPIQHHICFASYYEISGIYAATCCETAEIVQSFEARAVWTLVYFEDRGQLGIIPDGCPLILVAILLDNVAALRRHPRLQVLDVLRMMESHHFLAGGFLRVVLQELGVELVVVD